MNAKDQNLKRAHECLVEAEQMLNAAYQQTDDWREKHDAFCLFAQTKESVNDIARLRFQDSVPL